MKTIYLAAFPGGMRTGDMISYALCEDGVCLAQHLSSSLEFAKHDMGLTSSWKHNAYHNHCPEGYQLEWVDDPETDAGWLAAKVLNHAAAVPESEAAHV
jgi:hypothetical protein